MNSNTYFTADTHFGHTNILKFCANTRPYDTVEEMDIDLINKWNDIIGPEDHIYHLGDVSFAKEAPTLKILKRLNGVKFLIKGNHDKISPKVAKQWQWVKDYHELKLHGRKLVLCHYPIESWSGGGNYRPETHQSWHLHGHCHGKATLKPGRLDVGVDSVQNWRLTGYPWNFEEISKAMVEINCYLEI